MLWLKVALLSAFLIFNCMHANPIDGELHNDDFSERKFQISKSFGKKFQLDESMSYRLPNDSIPIHYDIRLTTNIHEGDKNFTGNVKIHIRIVQVTDKVTLHYRQIEVEQIEMWNAALTNLITRNLAFDYIESHDFLVITLPDTYNPQDEFVLDISYNGKLRDEAAGFYWGSYDNNGQEKFYAATQFAVDDARHAMPCYDEPGIRAVMKLRINHHDSYSAISNTPVLGSTPMIDNIVSTQFKETPEMQTYLLAFIISDFEHVNATGNTRIPQRIFGTPKEIREGQGDFAASVVGEILGKFEDIFNTKYPLDKMDHAGLKKFNFGAMENFGLITYAEQRLMLDLSLSESEKLNQQNAIISLIAHEYAHQWFGNLISPQWWTYTWLNEGFATLFANYIPDLLYPNRNFMRNFFTSTMPVAFSRDSEDSWSMNQYTENPNELWDKFDAIGYQKSGCVLRMFMEVLTPEVFLKGINIYFEKNYMKAATPDELHLALQEAYNQTNPGGLLNVHQMMYSWENQPGYPLISVSMVNDSITFQQRRYPENNNELYSVPLTFATKTNPDFITKTPKQWLYNAYLVMPQISLGFTSNDWIVVNIDQVGYYRVDYDTTLWDAIISQLNNKHDVIPPINRALLQDEFFLGLTEFNRVSGTDALKIISYFDKEDEAIVWGRAQQTFNYLNDNLFGTRAYDKFLELVRDITSTHLTELGYTGFDGEDPDKTSLRNNLKFWNCKALDGACIIQEYQKLRAFFDGASSKNIDFCSAMRLIDSNDFAKVVEIIMSDGDENIKRDFIKNLGCSLDPSNQIELLKLVGDASNSLENIEREFLLIGLYRNSNQGLNSALSFIAGNYIKLAEVVDVYEIMYHIIYGIKEDSLRERFVKLVNSLTNDNITTAEQRMILIIELTNNMKWMEDNYSDVLKFFEIDDETTSTTTIESTTTSSTSSTNTPTASSATTSIPSTTTSTTSAVTPSAPSTTTPTTSASTNSTSTSTTTTTTSTTKEPVPVITSTTDSNAGRTLLTTFSLILFCAILHFIKIKS